MKKILILVFVVLLFGLVNASIPSEYEIFVDETYIWGGDNHETSWCVEGDDGDYNYLFEECGSLDGCKAILDFCRGSDSCDNSVYDHDRVWAGDEKGDSRGGTQSYEKNFYGGDNYIVYFNDLTSYYITVRCNYGCVKENDYWEDFCLIKEQYDEGLEPHYDAIPHASQPDVVRKCIDTDELIEGNFLENYQPYYGGKAMSKNYVKYDTCVRGTNELYEFGCNEGFDADLDYGSYPFSLGALRWTIHECDYGCVAVDGAPDFCALEAWAWEYPEEEEEEIILKGLNVEGLVKACNNGVDDDGDNKIDYDNGNGGWCDSDGDGFIEEDSGFRYKGEIVTGEESGINEKEVSYAECLNTYNAEIPFEEVTQCNDGIDNDGNGEIDFGEDAGCVGFEDVKEGETSLFFNFKNLFRTQEPVVGRFVTGNQILNRGDIDVNPDAFNYDLDGCETDEDCTQGGKFDYVCEEGECVSQVGDVVVPITNGKWYFSDLGCEDMGDDSEINRPDVKDLQVEEEEEVIVGYCNDGYDNDGDGFMDKYGACVGGSGDYDICYGANNLDYFEDCVIDCEKQDGVFYFPDAGCVGSATGREKNRCGDGYDNDRDKRIDSWGGCDEDFDGFIDYACGCDFDDDGYLDFMEGESISEQECDESYTYECIPLTGVGPLVFSDGMALGVQEGTKESCDGNYYLPDLECVWLGDDSEREVNADYIPEEPYSGFGIQISPLIVDMFVSNQMDIVETPSEILQRRTIAEDRAKLIKE